MSQDEIIEMARQAGIYHAQDSEYHWDGLTDQKIIERTPDSAKDIAWRNCRTFEILQPFAKLVAEKAIKEALAQPEQEPVAWPHKYGCRANAFGKCDMGCTTPPQRKPLTDEELEAMAENHVTNCYFDTLKFARAIEAAHNIKENT